MSTKQASPVLEFRDTLSPMPLEYREARLEDSESVARLLLELGHDGDEAGVRRRLERVLGHSEHVVFVAIERPHGVIGMVHAAVALRLHTRPSVEVAALIVSANYRRAGAGRGLLERVQGWALRRGIDDILARLQRHRKDGHMFLSQLGYAVSHENLNYERDLASPLKVGLPTKMD